MVLEALLALLWVPATWRSKQRHLLISWGKLQAGLSLGKLFPVGEKKKKRKFPDHHTLGGFTFRAVWSWPINFWVGALSPAAPPSASLLFQIPVSISVNFGPSCVTVVPPQVNAGLLEPRGRIWVTGWSFKPEWGAEAFGWSHPRYTPAHLDGRSCDSLKSQQHILDTVKTRFC